MFATNQITYDRIIENKLKDRFKSPIAELEAIGFSYLGAFETTHSLPLVPTAIEFAIGGKEVWEMDGLSRVKWYHPLMLSPDKMTIAYPMGIGMRYYTFFENGLAHRTSACHDDTTIEFKRESKLYIGNTTNGPISESWMTHLTFCKDHIHAGRLPVKLSSADRLIEMQKTEDSVTDELFVVLFGWGQVAATTAIICYYASRLLA